MSSRPPLPEPGSIAVKTDNANPNDVMTASTAFDSFDAQTIWNMALDGMGPNLGQNRGIEGAKIDWSKLAQLLGDGGQGLIGELTNLLKPLVGPGWVGDSRDAFAAATGRLETFARDIAVTAKSLGVVSAELEQHMRSVAEAVRTSRFTNGGQSWETNWLNYEWKADNELTEWLGQQNVTATRYNYQTGLPFLSEYSGLQWMQWRKGEISIDAGDAAAIQSSGFDAKMTAAVKKYLVDKQTLLFRQAGSHLGMVYTANYPSLPVPPPEPTVSGGQAKPGPGPGGSSFAGGGVRPTPDFDRGAGMPKPQSLLGSEGFTPTGASAVPGGSDFGSPGGGSALPTGVVPGGFDTGSGTDALTTPAAFSPSGAATVPDSLSGLSPAPVGGSFGPGSVRPDGTFVPAGPIGGPFGVVPPGGAVGGRFGAPIGGLDRPGPGPGMGLRGVGPLGRGVPLTAAGSGGLGVPGAGMPMMYPPPMYPPPMGQQHQPDGGQRDNVGDYGLFDVPVEYSPAVVDRRPDEPDGRGWP